MKWFFCNRYVKTFYLLAIITYAQANQISTHDLFNPLFPATPFKKVLASCMKIRNIAHLLHDYKDWPPDAELLLDSIIGRITFLNSDLDSMLQSRITYKSNDLEYLLTIIDYMVAEINHAIKGDIHEHSANITHLIGVIKKRLNAALETA